MTALAEILIRQPIATVWNAVVDASAHPHWLGPGCVTHYEDELHEGCKFRYKSVHDGVVREGEILSIRAPRFFKTRVDLTPDSFETAEYHLFELNGTCLV